MAAFNSANGRMLNYLKGTAYTTATTNLTSLVRKWLNDSTQSGATTQSATQRFKKILANAASL